MKLTELFDKGEFVITSEVGPVKGCLRSQTTGKLPQCAAEAEMVRGHVHAINVTDNQSAVMRLGSLAASVRLKERGFEPIYQMTCRDRNRIALQSDLLGACSLGIDNVLCLTGDYTSLGDHKSAKSVFDIDSVQLLKIAKGLNDGHDMMGNALTQSTNLALGAVVNPNFEPLDLQLLKMEKKIEAGAQFFQTQAVYDPAVFEKMAKKTEKFGVPVQYGVVVVKSPQMGKFMNDNVSGINVPEWIIKEMGSVSKEDRKKKAIEITIKLIKEIRHIVQGVHFMPLGWSDIVPEIVKAVNG
ncbi:MAG: 5,10-methylenetetrahydrofolate reductase [Desulfobacteraceae bacterium IS3]|nr:MAG: 5,10-methylenetetrahydrofolate reductase [Desulfobacteraceae bacterium IS3]